MSGEPAIGPAPKFAKRNHHVVPKSWQMRFSAPSDVGPFYKDVTTGVLRGPEGPGNKMSEEYVNIVFDDYFRPSDALEDRLAVIEGKAIKALDRVISSAQIGSSDKIDLAYFLALQACRYPELFGSHLELGKYLAIELGDAAHFTDATAFNQHLQVSGALPGASLSDDEFTQVAALPEDERAEQLTLLIEAYGYEAYFNPDLVINSTELVAEHLLGLEWNLLEDSSLGFILSDRPMPVPTGYAFSVGLSARLGLRCSVAAQPPNEDAILAVPASPADTQAMNQEVRGRAQKWICGAGSWIGWY